LAGGGLSFFGAFVVILIAFIAMGWLAAEFRRSRRQPASPAPEL